MSPVDLSLKDNRLWYFRAFINQVVNGDTVVATVDKGFNTFALLTLRLSGVDADPGIFQDGRIVDKAKRRLADLVEGYEVLLLAHRTRKRDRWAVEIFLPSDRNCTVNKVLLDEGLVKPFVAGRARGVR